jgi:serine/threonine protein kinase
VYLVESKRNGKLYALKVIKKKLLISDKDILNVKREKFLLKNLKKNRFIVNLHHTFQDSVNLYLQLEYLNGGNIYSLMKRKLGFSDEELKFYVVQIIHALSSLHTENVIYRDLKPENVMILEKEHIVKVGLFQSYA